MKNNPCKPVFMLSLCSVVVCSCLSACATPAVQDLRTGALENRQGRMNQKAEGAAERRQIRSDNMDARTKSLFDSM